MFNTQYVKYHFRLLS